MWDRRMFNNCKIHHCAPLTVVWNLLCEYRYSSRYAATSLRPPLAGFPRPDRLIPPPSLLNAESRPEPSRFVVSRSRMKKGVAETPSRRAAGIALNQRCLTAARKPRHNRPVLANRCNLRPNGPGNRQNTSSRFRIFSLPLLVPICSRRLVGPTADYLGGSHARQSTGVGRKLRTG